MQIKGLAELTFYIYLFTKAINFAENAGEKCCRGWQ